MQSLNRLQNQGFRWWRRPRWRVSRLSAAIAIAVLLWFAGAPSARASLNDDRFDGNIYALYGGNGSLVPPKVTFRQALKRDDKATLVVFYLDDSRDCKQFASVVSQLQAYYGRAADILPLNVDAITTEGSFTPNDAGYYYEGVVPQTVVFDQSGKKVYSGLGQVDFGEVDRVLRKLYNLVPRDESQELKKRSFNEFNSELAPD
ncbi:thylakoid membrane photosystem I accumulation factor [Oxynema aestuarii]|uniref:thylakoid membrane photosystem I accumulation factor n=1 Tax=Oxynema aestuarii TaxID=2874213 RepID=UPI001B315C25|nr:thylakoid membrane photosystem I accumulation factor [Oxynema aestuarii]